MSQINNIPVLVQIMAQHRPGDKLIWINGGKLTGA